MPPSNHNEDGHVSTPTSSALSKRKAKALGINHITLEVGDIDAALEFYGNF